MVAPRRSSSRIPRYHDESRTARQTNLMYLGLGCGFTFLFAAGALVAGLVWISSGPEGGVRLKNEMEEYALEYLETHSVLSPDEEIVAYYDTTIALDGSEAVILTSSRIICHKNGRNDFLPLADVEDIRHRNEFLEGDIFEVYTDSGEGLKFTIDPLNQGETFKNALLKTWKIARNANRKKGAPPPN